MSINTDERDITHERNNLFIKLIAHLTTQIDGMKKENKRLETENEILVNKINKIESELKSSCPSPFTKAHLMTRFSTPSPTPTCSSCDDKEISSLLDKLQLDIPQLHNPLPISVSHELPTPPPRLDVNTPTFRADVNTPPPLDLPTISSRKDINTPPPPEPLTRSKSSTDAISPGARKNSIGDIKEESEKIVRIVNGEIIEVNKFGKSRDATFAKKGCSNTLDVWPRGRQPDITT